MASTTHTAWDRTVAGFVVASARSTGASHATQRSVDSDPTTTAVAHDDSKRSDATTRRPAEGPS